MKIYRERNLPHIYPVGGVFFITFRLDDSLPRRIIRALESEYTEDMTAIKLQEKSKSKQKALLFDLKKKKFGKYDHQLDAKPYGACYMKDESVAQIIYDKIMKFDGLYYTVDSLSIMPNHVHMLVDTSVQLDSETGLASDDYVQVDKWMRLIKGGSSRAINRHLGRSGKLWSPESYDHYARDEEEILRIREYILDNPVKAGLELRYRSAPYMYCLYHSL